MMNTRSDNLRKTRELAEPKVHPVVSPARRNKFESADAARKGSTRLKDRLLAMIAYTNVSVFVSGGTSDDRLAFAAKLHSTSDRRGSPFVHLDCPELDRSSLAILLFGSGQPEEIGMFGRTQQGTLFLDQVESLPIDFQRSILRVLQDREYLNGGGRRKQIDFRLVSAVANDPEGLIKHGKLDRDLYHQLNIFPIQIDTSYIP